MKNLVLNFIKLLTQSKKIKNNNEYQIIDNYKKEYTTNTPFSNCLNLTNNYLNILDIGCFGQNVPEQYSSQKSINFYGIDIDTNIINYLKEKYSNNKN
jgi:2-polyprenyl-3-methyl-5-hydroxy-6-metoxy-1,4-benzoquinol methylase